MRTLCTSIALAGYFHDPGKDDAIVANSSPRRAKALRETSGRLGEMLAD